jgi:hypothetical protein
VTFLGILFVNESHVLFTYDMENCIIALTAINFLLPTVAIYKLSVSDFGSYEWPMGKYLMYTRPGVAPCQRIVISDFSNLTLDYDHKDAKIIRS